MVGVVSLCIESSSVRRSEYSLVFSECERKDTLSVYRTINSYNAASCNNIIQVYTCTNWPERVNDKTGKRVNGKKKINGQTERVNG